MRLEHSIWTEGLDMGDDRSTETIGGFLAREPQSTAIS